MTELKTLHSYRRFVVKHLLHLNALVVQRLHFLLIMLLFFKGPLAGQNWHDMIVVGIPFQSSAFTTSGSNSSSSYVWVLLRLFRRQSYGLLAATPRYYYYIR